MQLILNETIICGEKNPLEMINPYLKMDLPNYPEIGFSEVALMTYVTSTIELIYILLSYPSHT